MLLANTHEIDITPALGTLINGEFNSRYASHVADPLFAKALYLHIGAQAQLYIMVDICVMKREFIDPIKHQIEKITGIPTTHQMIASTHTHYGGSVSDLLLAHADLAYREILAKKLVELAKIVTADAIPAKIGFGKIEKPEHLTCRRYLMDDDFVGMNPVSHTQDLVKTNPFGYESQIISRTTVPDPEVCYLTIKSLDDKWIGMLANYNLHYVGDSARSTITADYFGHFARKVKENIGEPNMVVMMSNGTSGEINIWDFIDGDRYPKEDHAKSKLIGEDVANAVCANLAAIQYKENSKLDVIYKDLSLEIRSLDNDSLQKAFEILRNTDYESLSYMDKDLMNKVYAREQVLLTQYPMEIPFPIQCFKIGDVLIGTLGGEFFTKTGKHLKAESSNYFTICLANDYVGYVPPKEEFANGGYETWRARSSYLAENSEDKITAEMIEIIKKIA